MHRAAGLTAPIAGCLLCNLLTDKKSGMSVDKMSGRCLVGGLHQRLCMMQCWWCAAGQLLPHGLREEVLSGGVWQTYRPTPNCLPVCWLGGAAVRHSVQQAQCMTGKVATIKERMVLHCFSLVRVAAHIHGDTVRCLSWVFVGCCVCCVHCMFWRAIITDRTDCPSGCRKQTGATLTGTQQMCMALMRCSVCGNHELWCRRECARCNNWLITAVFWSALLFFCPAGIGTAGLCVAFGVQVRTFHASCL